MYIQVGDKVVRADLDLQGMEDYIDVFKGYKVFTVKDIDSTGMNIRFEEISGEWAAWKFVREQDFNYCIK